MTKKSKLTAGLYGRTFVHLSTRPPPPHFYIFNGPSSESVHEMYGLSSSTVHPRPFRTNNHGLSSNRPPPKFLSSTFKWLSWSSVRIRPSDGRSEPKFRSVVHMDGWTVRRRPSTSVEAWFELNSETFFSRFQVRKYHLVNYYVIIFDDFGNFSDFSDRLTWTSLLWSYKHLNK